MAKYNALGVEGLQLSFEEFAAIPDAVVENMLMAGGEVVAAAQRTEIQQLGLHRKGLLGNSIKIHRKAGSAKNGNQRYVLIYPEGAHHTYNRREVTKKFARSKHDRTYTVGGGTAVATNDEIGFVHEFGAPARNIKASRWMAKANEKSADAMVAAELDVYDEWLKSINL